MTEDSDGEPSAAVTVPSAHCCRRFPSSRQAATFRWPTLSHFKGRIHDLFDAATRRYPLRALHALDKVSRAWLVRNGSAASGGNRYGRQGAGAARHLLLFRQLRVGLHVPRGSWTRGHVGPSDPRARLDDAGSGAQSRVRTCVGRAGGPFVVLTWPGYTGVLQVMAPGRFCAALNQAPMRISSGLYYLDWASGRRRVWACAHDDAGASAARRVGDGAHVRGGQGAALTRTPDLDAGHLHPGGYEAGGDWPSSSAPRTTPACARARTSRPIIGRRRAGMAMRAASTAPAVRA